MKAKKSLGQNFLQSQEVINDIVLASGVKSGDIVLEIGPGQGVLTKGLLETGVKVIAVEKDDRLINPLEQKFKKEISEKKLQLVHADVLDVQLPNLINGPYMLVANIPYYITGQIIRMFLESDTQPVSMTLLVQKEVAERIVAKDGKESLLSLSVKIFGEPKLVREVSKEAFVPEPSVDSAVLNIQNISKERLGNISKELFFKVIHLGFAHKRKQLLANLSLEFERKMLSSVFEKLGLDKRIRSEDLSLKEWLLLCANIKQ